MAKWGTDQTIKFLKEYSTYNCLWDYNDEQYKNKNSRNDALRALAAFMNLENFDANAAKNKIHSIRNTYMNEMTKIARSKKYGKVYKPQLPWFNLADNFLRKIVKKRETQSKLVLIDQTTNNSAGTFCDSISEKGTPSFVFPPLDKIMFAKSQKPESSISASNVEKDAHPFSSQSSKPWQLASIYPSLFSDHYPPECTNESASEVRKKTLGHLLYLENALASLRDIPSSKHREDEFDAFARSIAMQMRSLPVEEGLELQGEIQNLVVQKRLVSIRKRHTVDNVKAPSVPVSHSP